MDGASKMALAVARRPDEQAHWLQVCREHTAQDGQRFRLAKTAELGGDGQDASFENSFSNLAHSYLRSIAPTLLDHELGFQLLERNQENTKAVGVFAFKVGSQELFAPVFFLRGQLKGHELLYIKNTDMFVPLKENWITYIMNRKPTSMGTGTDRQTSRLGVVQPNLSLLSQSPTTKHAAWVRPALRPFMPKFAALQTSSLRDEVQQLAAHCQAKLSLSAFLKQASLPVLHTLVNTLQRRPHFAAEFMQFHPLTEVAEAIKLAHARPQPHSTLDGPLPPVRQRYTSGSIFDKQAAAVPNQGDETEKVTDGEPRSTKEKVRVVYLDEVMKDGDPEFMTDADKELLFKKRILVQDDRGDTEVSRPINTDAPRQLFNPTESGLYMVLTKPGTFRKCYVVIAPHGPAGRKTFACIVDVADKTTCNTSPSQIWCAQRIEGKEFQTWFDGLGESESLSADWNYIVLGPRGEGSVKFRVESSLGTADDGKTYDVSFDDYCGYSSASSRPHDMNASRGDSDYSSCCGDERVHLQTAAGSRLRSHRGDLYVPADFKVWKLRKQRKYDDPEPEPQPLQAGDPVDAELSLMNKTASLKLIANGNEVWINDQQPISELAALACLVQQHGLREKTANELLLEARRLRGLTVRIKYASPYLTPGDDHGPAMPEFASGYNPMGFNGPTVGGDDMTVPIPGMAASQTDPQIYNPNPANTPSPQDMMAVQQAAQTGQKEIFDTAMISSLLKRTTDDALVDSYLPDLLKAIDRIGRILFQFYWHGDKFADRYGKQDMPELEDSLRNTFEQCGDLTIFLKQKSVDPYPEDSLQGFDLHDTASS